MREAAMAQAAWRLLEAYHAVVYFAPEHRQACDQAGLRGGWMAYFASRAAPLGPAPPELVTALFYNFHPAMVTRSLPDAWSFASPDAVLEARYRGVDAALRRILGPVVDGREVVDAAEIAAEAAAAGDPAGRPMFAANLALPWPDAPHMRLWHAATLLREHRGDGHVSCLLTAEVDGCAAHVLQVAAGHVPRAALQPHRGWSDQDWDHAEERLRARGWIDEHGRLTEAGRRNRNVIDRQTDRLAASAFTALDHSRSNQLLEALRATQACLQDAGDVPYPNPMGVPRP